MDEDAADCTSLGEHISERVGRATHDGRKPFRPHEEELLCEYNEKRPAGNFIQLSPVPSSEAGNDSLKIPALLYAEPQPAFRGLSDVSCLASAMREIVRRNITPRRNRRECVGDVVHVLECGQMELHVEGKRIGTEPSLE